MCSVEAATLGPLQIDTRRRCTVGTASSANLLNPRKADRQRRGDTIGDPHRVNQWTRRQRVRRQKLFVARLTAALPHSSFHGSQRRFFVLCRSTNGSGTSFLIARLTVTVLRPSSLDLRWQNLVIRRFVARITVAATCPSSSDDRRRRRFANRLVRNSQLNQMFLFLGV